MLPRFCTKLGIPVLSVHDRVIVNCTDVKRMKSAIRAVAQAVTERASEIT